MHIDVPFPMQGITQCREKLGSYSAVVASKNPPKFRDEFESLSVNFSLIWRDIIVILTWYNDEEKARTLDQARKVVDERQWVDQSGPC